MNKYSVHIKNLTVNLADEVCNFCIFSDAYNPLKENAELIWQEMHRVFDDEPENARQNEQLEYELERAVIYHCAEFLPRGQTGLFGDRIKHFHNGVELLKFLIEQHNALKKKMSTDSEIDSFVHVADSTETSETESAPEVVNELALFHRLFKNKTYLPLKNDKEKKKKYRRR